MKSNYKKLGSYIKEVSLRNRDLSISYLLGVSISKKFIPSIANIIGTDLSSYKIVKQNQFAYGPVTSRNGDKISIALLEDEECIISSSYTVFEIVDKELLDPEYLMMWFRRPEFDRYARFMSHGSVREIFGWEEMCDIELPVPDIEVQREIVKEYNTIQNNIKTNEEIIKNLEDTANTIYKEWFVDFNFPDENGNPYQKSDGKMTYNPTLEKLIPDGWEVGTLSGIATYLNGLAMQKFEDTSKSSIPVLKIRELNQGFCDEQSNRGSLSIPEKYIIKKGDVVFSWSGTLKLKIWHGETSALNQHLFKVTSDYPKWFYYMWTLSHMNDFIRYAESRKTSMGHIKRENLDAALVLSPSKHTLLSMTKIYNPIFNELEILNNVKDVLRKSAAILLSKMSSSGVENEQ